MRYAFALCASLLLVCCAPSREARINYVKTHERPARIDTAIVREKVAIGMTKSDVRASWGDPDHANTSYYVGGTTRTQWCYDGSGMQCIYFEGGHVTGWN